MSEYYEVVSADAEHLALEGCTCPICTGDVLVTGSDEASLDPSAGGTFNGKPIWTPEQVAAHLNRTGGGFADGYRDTANVGRQNNIGDDNSVITFGFFNTQQQLFDNGYVYRNASGQLAGLSEYFNFAAFSDAQRAATREVMQAWDDVAAVSFREVGADEADMNFGNLASAPTTQAYARIPTAALDATLGGQVREIGGDSWISASQASNFQLDEGGYGMQTLLHEAGHSLGLSHPGGYNAAPGVSITYAANAEYAQDTRAYSVMSYFQGNVIAGVRHFDFNISTTVYSAVPLIHDIAAIQAIYGADTTTRTDDTVYGFNSTAGRDSYDFAKTPAPVMAIWDAGGVDTLDASGYATEQLIDLTAGSLSSIGGVTYDTAPSFEQVNANRAAAGFAPVARATYDANMTALQGNAFVGRLTDNVGIAYGVTIENAKGGSGVDTMIGNDVANILEGGAGADKLSGRAGDDKLLGGEGDDQLFGDAGADRLEGGAGADRLNGGDGLDLMIGGAGADLFVGEITATKVVGKIGAVSVDMVADFEAGLDKLDLSGIDANALVDGDQAFSFIRSANPKNAGELALRSFGNVNAAESVLGFDIDGVDGASPYAGQVTVLLGNVDGGEPDFALVLFGTRSVALDDLLL
ncbi:M10 family metallopeptidase C-terminal domain-containing protein [Sphingomonas lenta]|uniref:Peptidase metallopeptidase domain-containing protein n=1 Tax=Sphingomonas lenta TaxID=1141887 RepID=A0A2A2SG44_9SPHN|nr:M10 family metallopeptidase C-terminal domain-containing protein [Sphingomonas lenta]PAX08173.1 hypothetical protein CKY28_11390 [Sphingomonas lenta]